VLRTTDSALGNTPPFAFATFHANFLDFIVDPGTDRNRRDAAAREARFRPGCQPLRSPGSPLEKFLLYHGLAGLFCFSLRKLFLRLAVINGSRVYRLSQLFDIQVELAAMMVHMSNQLKQMFFGRRRRIKRTGEPFCLPFLIG